jgi:hypothetical protein
MVLTRRSELQFNYDLDAIREDLRKREKASGQPTVSLPPKRITKKAM